MYKVITIIVSVKNYDIKLFPTTNRFFLFGMQNKQFIFKSVEIVSLRYLRRDLRNVTYGFRTQKVCLLVVRFRTSGDRLWDTRPGHSSRTESAGLNVLAQGIVSHPFQYRDPQNRYNVQSITSRPPVYIEYKFER